MRADGVEEVWVWRGEKPRKMLGVPVLGVAEVWVWRGENPRKMLGVPVLSNVLFARSIISGLGTLSFLVWFGYLEISKSLPYANTYEYLHICSSRAGKRDLITRTHAQVFLSSICCVTV